MSETPVGAAISRPLIECRDLVKTFGAIEAVRGIGFTLGRGEVLGFLGPNGAGKSTTMKMLAGFLAPTRGSAAICGFDIESAPVEAKRRLGYLPEGAPCYPDMEVGGFLSFIAGLRGFSGARAARAVELAIERLELGGVVRQPIETLSKGFKRRVGLAQAILHDPEVLILDEPTDGLDPNQKQQVRALIRAMAADKAIIVSTHILEEVDAVCTRAMIIGDGRILADGTPAELEARSPYHGAVYLRLAAPLSASLLAAIQALPEAAKVEQLTAAGDEIRILCPPGGDLLAASSRVLSGGAAEIRELRAVRGQLEDVFRAVTNPARH